MDLNSYQLNKIYNDLDKIALKLIKNKINFDEAFKEHLKSFKKVGAIHSPNKERLEKMKSDFMFYFRENIMNACMKHFKNDEEKAIKRFKEIFNSAEL